MNIETIVAAVGNAPVVLVLIWRIVQIEKEKDALQKDLHELRQQRDTDNRLMMTQVIELTNRVAAAIESIATK